MELEEPEPKLPDEKALRETPAGLFAYAVPSIHSVRGASAYWMDSNCSWTAGSGSLSRRLTTMMAMEQRMNPGRIS